MVSSIIIVANHGELVEDAIKYIIFLVDADKLFDVALGMYDFSLVLLVAQNSQKVSGSNFFPLCISAPF